MKLNHECVRDTLLTIEKLQRFFVNNENEIEKAGLPPDDLYQALPKYSKEDIFYAVYNLEQAGFISMSIKWMDSKAVHWNVNHMTFAGHEFLDTIRDKKRWKGIKKALPAIRNYSLEAIEAVASGMTSAAISTFLSRSES